MGPSGRCDERFEAVRAAFVENFEERGEIGAAVAVEVGGRLVVDLWGGVADSGTGRPWDEDTLAVVFSTTKGMTAGCALLLWERQQLDIDAPVTDVWPEFAAGDKAGITTRQLLSHQAGLPAFDEPITVEQCHTLGLAAERLATQTPRWEPGSDHGYHALTFGWLVGEVVRRVSGRTIGRYFANEVAGPLKLDAHIGLAPEHEPRVATLVPPRIEGMTITPDMEPMVQAILDPSSTTFAVFTNPPIVGNVSPFNDAALHQAEWPAASGVTNARALARFYGALAGGELLSGPTLTAAEEVQAEGTDRVLLQRSSFGLGFMLPSDVISYGPAGDGFGHGGAGGSLAFGDRRTGVGFGYVMNQMNASLTPDPRAQALVRAVYAALGE